MCLVLLAGLAMPPHFGIALPLILALGMAVVGWRRVDAIVRARAALQEGLGGPVARVAMIGVAAVTVALMATVLVRGVGALMIAFPAAIWGVGAAVGLGVVAAVIGPRLPARARPVVVLLAALCVPAAGVYGTRYEAAADNARGWAHSGPILGIHPGQITAVMVDGEGPFDVPINDYVEPDGGRGYGPEALADAIDRALAAAADRVYPDGPARMRRALIDAEVEAVETDAVWEKLSREPVDDVQPRFVVHSGSFGQGSRVEFVCPGRRIDPRGPRGESVMNKMCPDSYAPEGSAGLGVTGRWSGYAEARGNARLGLFQWRGWTRTDDDDGREVIERETRWWAWLLLLLIALVLPRPTASAGAGVGRVAGALGLMAVVLLTVMALTAGRAPEVDLWSGGPTWAALTDLRAWAPALALGGLAIFAVPGPTDTPGPAIARTVAVPAILVVVTTLTVAAVLPALGWAIPFGRPSGAELPAFVLGLAEAVGERGGLSIFEVEGLLAATLAAILAGGAVAVVQAGVGTARRLAPSSEASKVTMVTALAILGIAAALVVSRKTAGAAALMPGVVGMTLVFGSALARISRRADRRAIPGLLVHLLWTVAAGALVWASIAPLATEHWFVIGTAILGFVAVFAAGVSPLLVRPSAGKLDPA